MWQKWRHLLFLHWQAPRDSLASLIPRELELDLWDGAAYVGLVPFTMHGVRPRGVPSLPCVSRFHEVNVRTYVRRNGTEPGVWFFSLDAANPLPVAAARLAWALPYYCARMHLCDRPQRAAGVTADDAARRIEYRSDRVSCGWERGAQREGRCRATYEVVGAATASKSALETFLIERYLLYACRGGKLWSGRVRHSPYPLRPVRLLSYEETLLAASGIKRPGAAPLVHYSPGVDVAIEAPRRVRREAAAR